MSIVLQKPRTLICCCCGSETQGRQWYNRDIGYGLCADCVPRCSRGETPASMKEMYGIRGMHYDLKHISTYRGLKLVDIPSGMGGVLPAAVSRENEDGTYTVICLHSEYFPNWVLTVNADDCRHFTYKLDDDMKKIIDGRVL